MSSQVKSYRDLIVWQKAMDLVEESYRLSQKLPEGGTRKAESLIG